MSAVSCKFISRKIRKIRWRPAPSDGLDVKPEYFTTGSWDDKENKISLWNLSSEKNGNYDGEAKLASEICHEGDVSDLQFFSHDVLLSASSNGTVTLYRIQKNQTLKFLQKWECVHKFFRAVSNAPRFRMSSCTSLTVKNDNIVTSGEDGRLVHLNANNKAPVAVIDDADTCAINAVMFVRQMEVATANTRGQLKIWDLRNKSNLPVQKFSVSGDQVGLECLTQHPSQPQVIASGGEDGSLFIWDMRQEKYPATHIPAHSNSMLEVQFHPRYPNHLFSCSEDGSVWHWDCSEMMKTQIASFLKPNKSMEVDVSDQNPWLTCTTTKHRLQINSLLGSTCMPINSLDIVHNTLLCGGDNEAFFIVKNLEVET